MRTITGKTIAQCIRDGDIKVGTDKTKELLQDAKSECGCYEIGEWCYDKWGEPMHLAGEECSS